MNVEEAADKYATNLYLQDNATPTRKQMNDYLAYKKGFTQGVNWHRSMVWGENSDKLTEAVTEFAKVRYPLDVYSTQNMFSKHVACRVGFVNGAKWQRSRAFTENFANMVKNEERFFLQISSFKGLYDNYDEIHKPGLKAIRLFGKRAVVCDDDNDIKMKPLGRACGGAHYEEAKRINGFPSCANSCLILSQFKDIEEIGIGALMESQSRFCLPIVSWNGGIRLGEGEQCKVIANINEPIEEISKKLIGFKPCGGCDSYKWHFQTPQTVQEKQICGILWPDKNQ